MRYKVVIECPHCAGEFVCCATYEILTAKAIAAQLQATGETGVDTITVFDGELQEWHHAPYFTLTAAWSAESVG